MSNDIGCVYFAGLGGLVKIGKSIHPTQRLAQIANELSVLTSRKTGAFAGQRLTLLSLCRTDKRLDFLEEKFHGEFSDLRVSYGEAPHGGKEWFRREGTLAEYIEESRSLNPYMALECDHVNQIIHGRDFRHSPLRAANLKEEQ